ncbi:MAG: class I SAM-dependent methyltransferase [Acidimicrobiales bacterium]
MDTNETLFGGSVPDAYREYLEPVIFRPWAERLVDFVGVAQGQTVLDVATGTGVAARAAAARAGQSGRVIASDFSAAMLAQVARGPTNGDAALEILECSATGLRLADDAVDVVVCQQGFQFIPDRRAAAVEMHRVLRQGGKVGIAVWLSSRRVEPFIVYGEALQAHGLPEPFAGAYDSSMLSMSAEEIEEALASAGFASVEVRVEQVGLDWPDPTSAARGIMGTPYGPVIAALDNAAQQEIMAEVQRRMTSPDGRAVRHVMTSVLARATAP